MNNVLVQLLCFLRLNCLDIFVIYMYFGVHSISKL